MFTNNNWDINLRTGRGRNCPCIAYWRINYFVRIYNVFLIVHIKLERFFTFLPQGVEGVAHVIDPKAMSKEALYGVLDPNTREWTDGLFTHILRWAFWTECLDLSQRKVSLFTRVDQAVAAFSKIKKIIMKKKILRRSCQESLYYRTVFPSRLFSCIQPDSFVSCVYEYIQTIRGGFRLPRFEIPFSLDFMTVWI